LDMLLAFGLTGVCGAILEQKNFQLPEHLTPVELELIAGGVLLVVVERWLRGRPLRDQVTWTVAVAVCIGQLLAAAFPGASRSGSTILLSLMLGLSRPAAMVFSFLVGIPTMSEAGGLNIFWSHLLAIDVPSERSCLSLLGGV